jgi:hypothetical protein
MKQTSKNTFRMPLQSYDIFVNRVPFKGSAYKRTFADGHRFNKNPSVCVRFVADGQGNLVKV